MGNSNSSKYSPKTTSDDIMKEFGTNAKDKYVIVTGGNSGLGYEASRAFAEYGANVVIACRNPQLGKEAVDKIKEKYPEALISTMILDLASLASIDTFVDEYKASGKPLHILMNNAGVMACPLTHTKDGFEMQFGTNHIGHFYLTKKLIDALLSTSTTEVPARIINLSSIGNYLTAPTRGIRFSDLKGERSYEQWDRYGSSKLANILFNNELHRRYFPKIISVAVHPGFINETNLSRHMTGGAGNFLAKCLTHRTINHVMFAYFKNTKEGTATQLLAALDPTIVSGEYYADCHIENSIIHAKAKDMELSKQLWDVSCELTKLPTVEEVK
jgi:retinol dehydrogenase-12